MLIAERPAADNRQDRLLTLRETCIGLRRPLHRRSGTVALGEREIVAHGQLISIANDRRARQCKHQAVSELDAPAIALQHRSEAATDASLVKLHPWLRAERREYGLPL